MKPGEEDWSIGCVVPVNAEGGKIKPVIFDSYSLEGASQAPQ